MTTKDKDGMDGNNDGPLHIPEDHVFVPQNLPDGALGSGTGGNVLPFKAPASKKKRGSGKLSKDALVAAYLDALSHSPLSLFPPFTRKFHVMGERGSEKLVVEEYENEILGYCHDSVLEDALLAYSIREVRGANVLSVAAAREVCRKWKAMKDPIPPEEIAPVREKSEPGKCWHRLPFDLEAGETPTFDEIMRRTSNATALMAFVGSLLVPGADRQQYIWIWGEGRNGKGSLAKFLKRLMGPAYRSEVPPSKGDRFWTSGILGSRLVVFADCNEFNFPTTGLFKTLTGGDAIRIERKGKDVSTVDIDSKFLFLSNEKPNLSSGEADMRRAIYCEMAGLPEGTEIIASAEYDARLWREGSAFLQKCMLAYAELASGNGPIKADAEATRALADAAEEHFAEMTDKFFDVDPDGHKTERAVARVGLQRLIQETYNIKNSREHGRFMQYLERKFKTKRTFIKRENGKTVFRMSGIAWKPSVYRDFKQVIDGALGGKGLVPDDDYRAAQSEIRPC